MNAISYITWIPAAFLFGIYLIYILINLQRKGTTCTKFGPLLQREVNKRGFKLVKCIYPGPLAVGPFSEFTVGLGWQSSEKRWYRKIAIQDGEYEYDLWVKIRKPWNETSYILNFDPDLEHVQ